MFRIIVSIAYEKADNHHRELINKIRYHLNSLMKTLGK